MLRIPPVQGQLFQPVLYKLCPALSPNSRETVNMMPTNYYGRCWTKYVKNLSKQNTLRK